MYIVRVRYVHVRSIFYGRLGVDSFWAMRRDGYRRKLQRAFRVACADSHVFIYGVGVCTSIPDFFSDHVEVGGFNTIGIKNTGPTSTFYDHKP